MARNEPHPIKIALVALLIAAGLGCWVYMAYHPDDFFPPPRTQPVRLVD